MRKIKLRKKDIKGNQKLKVNIKNTIPICKICGNPCPICQKYGCCLDNKSL